MRYFALVIFLNVFAFSCLAQSEVVEDSIPIEQKFPRNEDNRISFRDTLSMQGIEKSKAYASVFKWINSNYKSSKTIQEADSLNGFIRMRSLQLVKTEEIEGKAAGSVKYYINFKIDSTFIYTDIHGFHHADHSDKVGSGGKLELYVPNCKPKELAMKKWRSIKTQTYNFAQELRERLSKELLE